jgi:hypothetical protein
MSDARYTPELLVKMNDMLLRMPGVQGGKAFGAPTFKVNGRVFMYVGSMVVFIKLPADRVESLLAQGAEKGYLPSEHTTWLRIQHEDIEEFEQHEDLFWESVQHTAEGEKNAPKAAKNKAKKAESEEPPPHKAVIDKILLGMPGVTGGRAFDFPSYRANGKIFAYMGKSSIMIKLTESRVNELVEQQDGERPFSRGEWKAWLSIRYDDPEDYEMHQDLFWESAQGVLT